MNLFYVTCVDSEQARSLSRQLLEEKLIACANIFPTIESLYWWEDKITSSTEAVLIIKTIITPELSKNKLFARIQELHPYEVPCIVELDVTETHPAYHQWIKKSL